MNEVLNNIYSRRSVRMFQDKEIPKEVIDELIRAGNAAPTGSNAQPWRFVVIRDKDIRNKLAEMSVPKVEKWMEKYANEQFKVLRKRLAGREKDTTYYGAPLIVFVIGLGRMASNDCPMVCENMMLAARSLDIGSCWVLFGQLVVEEPEIKQMLELKDGESVYGPIIFGYPKGDFPKAPPKKEPSVKII
jgi:nitroreductase